MGLVAISRAMPNYGKMSPPASSATVNAPSMYAGRPDICVIANARSGATARVAAALDSAMTVFGDRAELRTFTGDPAPVAEQAIRDGFRVIVAAGGDGTVAGVAHALAGTPVSMGVLPMGTFNYFARGLHTPADAIEAANAILEGEPHDIAVGSVNGKIFLNNVALGLYPAILDEREAAYQRWGRSRMMAHWTTLRTLLRLQRPMHVRIVADGQVQIRRSPMIFVARSAYQLDQFGVVGAEAISDDRFAVYVARQTTRIGLLKLAWRLMRPGKVDLSDDLELLTPQTLVIDRPKRRRIRIAYDGEREKMVLPLTFRIDHHVLSVILPPTKAAVVKGST
jgi:diacylglycerol kinase family enzyme